MQTETKAAIPIVTINPADHAVRLTTTINLLRKAGACRERFAHLIRCLGLAEIEDDCTPRQLVGALDSIRPDKAELPINLLTILDHNGTEDCLWALCATAENCDTVARLMAADFAEAVLHIYERDYPKDSRPRNAINATRAFAIGSIGDAARDAARATAWDAAGAAARDAAGDAAGAAARAAARATAWDAAWDAAGDAAWDAAGATAWDAARDAARATAWDAAGAAARAAARDAQAVIIRRYLLP